LGKKFNTTNIGNYQQGMGREGYQLAKDKYWKLLSG